MHKNYNFIAPQKYYLQKPPELLFAQYDQRAENLTRKMHAHDFWQLEILIKGNIQVRGKHGKFEASDGDCILIPPGIPHRIFYKQKEQSSWSLKFKLQTDKIPDKIILMKRSQASINARQSILRVFDTVDTSIESCISLQYFLGILVELELQEESERSISLTVKKIKMSIDMREGGPCSIKELADELNLSRNHISKTFHQETGIPLKSYIDLRRAETACKMLLYSNLKITGIAELMGFPDLYSFSRFFTRLKKCSPKEYKLRNKIPAENT
jgi:AraC-like DNA-binding protein